MSSRLGPPQSYQVKPDAKQAFDYFKRAALRGLACAQNNLGVLYLRGEGVEKNAEEACSWFKSAADQGESYAQNSLGNLYREGKGVNKDRNEALKYYQLSAEQGNPYAQMNLGDDCHYRDNEKALGYYIRAADQGIDIALSLIRMLYSESWISTELKDRIKQSKYFKLIEEKGIDKTEPLSPGYRTSTYNPSQSTSSSGTSKSSGLNFRLTLPSPVPGQLGELGLIVRPAPISPLDS